MPGHLAHVGMIAMCPHAGQVQVVTSNSRVLLGGQPAATLSDTYTIAGCPFTVPNPTPQPCVKVQWLVPAMRVRIGGSPAILKTSTGLCLSAEQIPQGTPNVVTTQLRVKGT